MTPAMATGAAMADAAVIGAGLLGLAVAPAAAGAGRRRHRLRGGTPSGRARRGVGAGRPDVGPALPRDPADRLAARWSCSGRSASTATCAGAPRGGASTAARAPGSCPFTTTRDLLRLPMLTRLDRTRIALAGLTAARRGGWESMEERSARAWLVRRSGRRAFDGFWQPMLEAKLGSEWPHASAAFVAASTHRAYLSRQVGPDRRPARRVPMPARPAGGVPVGLGREDRDRRAGALGRARGGQPRCPPRRRLGHVRPRGRDHGGAAGRGALPGPLRARAGAPPSSALHRRRLPVAAAAEPAVPLPPDVRRRPDVAVQHHRRDVTLRRRPPQRRVPPGLRRRPTTPCSTCPTTRSATASSTTCARSIRVCEPATSRPAGSPGSARSSPSRPSATRGRCRGRRRRSPACRLIGSANLPVRQLQRERRPRPASGAALMGGRRSPTRRGRRHHDS